MKEAFQILEEASEEVGLVVNKGKTKYMVAANTQNCSKTHANEIRRYNFERVDGFTCLGSLVTGDYDVSEEITNCLIATNRSYFGLRSQLNPLNPELNPTCYLLALLAHHFLHVSRIRVKSLTLRLLMSFIYGAPIFDVSRSHTTTRHSL